MNVDGILFKDLNRINTTELVQSLRMQTKLYIIACVFLALNGFTQEGSQIQLDQLDQARLFAEPVGERVDMVRVGTAPQHYFKIFIIIYSILSTKETFCYNQKGQGEDKKLPQIATALYSLIALRVGWKLNHHGYPINYQGQNIQV